MTRFVKSLWVAVASIILLASCGYDSSDKSSNIQQLQQENQELRQQITQLEHREGYLVMSVWMAVVISIVLLCVGLAVGIKIKKAVIEHEERGP